MAIIPLSKPLQVTLTNESRTNEGAGSITTVSKSKSYAHVLSLNVMRREYTPASSTVISGITGFATDEMKPLGPCQS